MKPHPCSPRFVLILGLLVLALALPDPPDAAGQVVPPFTWVRTVTAESGPSGIVEDVAFDSQGHVLAAGELHQNQESEFTVAKFAPDGTELWVRTLPGSSGGAIGVAVDAQDNVIAVGIRGVNPPFFRQQSVVAKWDADGNLQWTATFSPNAFTRSRADAVAIDSQGDVLASGSIDNSKGRDWAVAKFSGADGTLLWTQRNNVSDLLDSRLLAVAVDSQDNVAAAGFDLGIKSNTDFLIVRLRGADGGVIWAREEGTAGSDSATDVTTDSDDNVVASGYLASGGGRLFAVARYNRDTGNRLWLGQSFGPLTGGSGAFAVDLDSQGNPVGMGAAQQKGVLNAAAAKYNLANGAQLWSRWIPPAVAGGFAYADHGVLDPSDNVILGGGSGGPLGNFTVFKLDFEGKPIWTRVLPSNGDGEVQAVATDSAGNIAAGGYHTPVGFVDVQFTVAYIDQIGPDIDECSVTPRSLPAAGGPVRIGAEVFDPDGVASVVARFSRANQPPVDIPLEDDDGEFEGTFVAPVNTTGAIRTYQVTVKATDRFGNETSEDCGTFTVAPGGRPATINSARIRLFRGGRLVSQGLFRRVGSGFTGRFLGLTPGQYRAEADGYASTNGTGPIIARGAGNAAVTARRTTVLRLNWVPVP